MPGVSRKTNALGAAAAALAVAICSNLARAQITLSNPIPSDFFELERPGHAESTLFLGGFGSDKYGSGQEGFQLEQSVTRYLGVFGRATGYQLFIGGGFASPLNPHAGSFSRLNFGRIQGGIDFAPLQGTHLFISGGHDVGDSDAYMVEGDFSSWMFIRSLHPINLTFSVIYDTQNKVTSSEIDLQAIAITREKYLFLLGAGGAVYGGGFLRGVEGQAGPDVTLYYRPWAVGLSAQAGYGDAHQYAQLSFFKQFGWSE